MGTFLHINLEPDGSTCRFNPRTIEDLDTEIGGSLYWSFCSTCQVDARIELEARGQSGPFDRFKIFRPMPTADNLVAVNLPCNGYGSASGSQATGSGDWKYHLTARPTGVGLPMDEIDPRLEIDDRPLAPPSDSPWPQRILLIVAGFLAGAYVMRRKDSRSRVSGPEKPMEGR